MDQIIVQFATENYLILRLAFTLLKGVAKITPWAWDDSIVFLFFGIFQSIRENNQTPAK